MDLFFDKEFREIIPPLQPDELTQLEASLKAEGNRDPIVIWKEKGLMLDGHNRYDICHKHNIELRPPIKLSFKNREDAKIWIIDNQLGRRNLVRYQRVRLILIKEETIKAKAKEKEHKRKTTLQNSVESNFITIDTQKELAKEAKVSHDTIWKVKRLEEKAPENIKAKLATGDMSINEAYTYIKRNQKELEQAEKSSQLKATSGSLINENYRLIHGDCAEIALELEPESIDYIITDPPYGKEYLQLYESLGTISKRLLKPTGSLFVMTGQSYLPDVLDKILAQMHYHWTICYLTPGDATILWQRKVHTNWKPILWFTTNGSSPEWRKDIVESKTKDKRFMEWGQSEYGMAELIQHFTKPGDIILDPFMGAGTTGVAAIRLKRKFVGIDISEEMVSLAKGRILNDKG